MNTEFMDRAVRLARDNVSSRSGGPFGAVVVKDGTIVGEGVNRVTRDKDSTAHAEVVAIRAACDELDDFDLSGCEIYTSCEPCPMCLAAIYWARIDRIYFAKTKQDAARIGFDDNFIYEEFARQAADRSVPAQLLEVSDAGVPFELWAADPEKIPY